MIGTWKISKEYNATPTLFSVKFITDGEALFNWVLINDTTLSGGVVRLHNGISTSTVQFERVFKTPEEIWKYLMDNSGLGPIFVQLLIRESTAVALSSLSEERLEKKQKIAGNKRSIGVRDIVENESDTSYTSSREWNTPDWFIN